MPDDVLQRIDAFYDHVHPDFKKRVTDPATGETRREWHSGFRMSPRRQQLIARFGETGGHARFAAWHSLPVVYRDRAKQALRRVRGQAHRLTDEQLNDGATAVAAAIVRCGALRRGSLETLRLADHPTDPERLANVYVPIRREKDVFARFDLAPVDIKKNGKPLHLLANAFCTEVLIWFRDNIRPELLRRRGSDPTNPYLFPGEGLRPRPEGKLTRDYARRAREQGFELDLHTNRALIGKIILDRDPTQMALVQQVLGHENIETTQSYYAAVNSLLAQKVWQQHLHEAERKSFETLGAATLRLAK
jgi:integrase